MSLMDDRPLCDLCWHEVQASAPRRPAEVVYTDPLGFRYALCGPHSRSLVAGLRRAAQRSRMHRAVAVPRRPYHQPTPRAQPRDGVS